MKQKFQIGDICKITRANNDILCYPKKKDEETLGFGLYVMIVGSYGQIFPTINKNDLNNYEIFVPYHLNKEIFIYNGFNFICKIPNGMSCYEAKEPIGTGWAWVSSEQLDFIRKPNKKDLTTLFNYSSALQWGKYRKTQSSTWIWNSWEQMASQYIDLSDIKNEVNND